MKPKLIWGLGMLALALTGPVGAEQRAVSPQALRDCVASAAESRQKQRFGVSAGTLCDGCRPTLLIDKLRVEGQLDDALARRVVRRRLLELQPAYLYLLRQQPKLKGSIALKLVIGSDGMVQEVEQESSTLESPLAEQCIVKLVQTWQFPIASSGTTQLAVQIAASPGSSRRSL